MMSILSYVDLCLLEQCIEIYKKSPLRREEVLVYIHKYLNKISLENIQIDNIDLVEIIAIKNFGSPELLLAVDNYLTL